MNIQIFIVQVLIVNAEEKSDRSYLAYWVRLSIQEGHHFPQDQFTALSSEGHEHYYYNNSNYKKKKKIPALSEAPETLKRFSYLNIIETI